MRCMREGLLARLRPYGVLAILVLSAGLGLGEWSLYQPRPASYVTCGDDWGLVSSLLGWAYFSAWSLSFWPQVIMNWERRSVAGLSFDFVFLNTVGFACYAAFNLALFFSADVRAEYAKAHGGKLPAVRAADVFFSVHALLLSSATAAQIFAYRTGAQRASLPCRLALAGLGLALPVALLLVALGHITALTLLYALSYVKLGITLTKYVPQAALNFRRRSTDGWSIENVCLDFTGGSLSLSQLLLDADCSADWSAVSGDPVKFGLGFVSMAFDTLFLLQHFVCFPRRAEPLALADGKSTATAGGVQREGEGEHAEAGRGAALPPN